MRIMDMDFTPLTGPSTIGFDRLIDLLENSLQGMPGSNYPPYNIEKTGEDSYRVTLAVAGFRARGSFYHHASEQADSDGQESRRGECRISLPGDSWTFIPARVQPCRLRQGQWREDLDKGLLTIDLMREVPDAMKPRRIVIGNGSKAIQIERQVAA